MQGMRALSPDVLKLDAAAEADRIGGELRRVLAQFRRKGLVVAISGGIDSAATAALACHALGPKRVFGLFLPEADSSGESLRLGQLLAQKLGIQTTTEVITPLLAAAGCYQRRDDAIRTVIPEYGDGWKSKIVLPTLGSEGYTLYSVVAQAPSGEIVKRRLTAEAYLGILAATNFKQRTRKMMEYYHADRLNYAVSGTPNRLEYDQGFFVKGGDGLADVKPIAHLYKTQVYQMAGHLGVPDEILRRPPTTDTYSLAQSQEEFYFSLPHHQMDLCLWGHNHQVPARELAPVVGLEAEIVERAYRDIENKRTVTKYLHTHSVLLGEVPELG